MPQLATINATASGGTVTVTVDGGFTAQFCRQCCSRPSWRRKLSRDAHGPGLVQRVDGRLHARAMHRHRVFIGPVCVPVLTARSSARADRCRRDRRRGRSSTFPTQFTNGVLTITV